MIQGLGCSTTYEDKPSTARCNRGVWALVHAGHGYNAIPLPKGALRARPPPRDEITRGQFQQDAVALVP